MEELRNFTFAVLSLMVAACVVIILERSFRDINTRSRNVKMILRIFAGILTGTGVWCMHLLNSQAIDYPSLGETGVIYQLLIYAITIGLLYALSYWIRSMLAEGETLRNLAYRDSLTGLENNNGMNHFWERSRDNTKLAVLFLDLNRFKSINDTLGHHVGDLLLKEVGAQLQHFAIKNRCYIFRIGGDEFVIIAKNYSQKQAEQLAVKILEKITRNYVLDQHELFVSGSIGIATNTGKLDRTRLLREADSAMYSAKQLGTGRYFVYK
jgi:diguanylate cyclase (GGDEF)-like protein